MATFKSSYENQYIEQILQRADKSPFIIYYDQTNKLYRFFPTEEKKDEWVEAYLGLNGKTMTEEIAAYEFTDPFTAPAPYTITITPLQDDNQYYLEDTTGILLKYSFKTTDGNGETITESVEAYYTFLTESGTSTSTTNIYNANTNVSMNIDEYLESGVNTVTIMLKGRSTGVTRTLILTYNIIQLKLTSTFDISRAFSPNSPISVTYNIKGEADKTIEFYIDGVAKASTSITSLETDATRTQIFQNTSGAYVSGKHSLQIRASMTAGGKTFYSNILYFEFVISGIEQTQILIQAEFPASHGFILGTLNNWDSNDVILSGEQYVQSTIVWAYYSSDVSKRTTTVTWRLYDADGHETSIGTRTADVVEAETDSKPSPIYFVPTESGNFNLQPLIGGSVVSGANYQISIIDNTSGLSEETEGLLLKLSAIGRSNDEPSSTIENWTSNGFETTFYNQPWTASSGWNNNALWLNGGAYCTINCKPFAEEYSPQTNGCVVEIEFETFNVDSENAQLFSIGSTEVDSITGNQKYPYLIITPTKATLSSKAGTTVVSRFKTEERVKLAFMIYPNSSDYTDYPLMMMIQANGVVSTANNYNLADTFNVGSTAKTSEALGRITIGDSTGNAGIKVYSIRVYRNVISMYDELDNFIIDSGENIESLVSRNNIYYGSYKGTEQISADKLSSSIMTVKITGNMELLFKSKTKTTIYGALEVICPEEPSVNIKCDHAQFSNAGQSTLGLPVPSMHVKLDKDNNVTYDRDGKVLNKNRWAFRTGNCPEKKFRLQANYMDSSGCHNGAFLRMFNKVAKATQVNGEYVLRMPAQAYALEKYPAAMLKKYGEDPNGNNWAFPYDLHMVPDSRPCVVVWRPDDTTTKYSFLGQYVVMEEKNANFTNGMRSIYDSVDSDMNPDPFNFTTSSEGSRLWDNSNCRQFEILRNSHDLVLFKSAASWNTIDPETLVPEREQGYEMEYPDSDDVVEDYEKGKSSKTVNDYWNEFYKEFVKPVCDTYKNHTAFANLYGTKLNRWHFAAYYCLMMRHCCVDSVVRNMELTTYDLKTWLPKWWDVDMQCGVQQSGLCDVEPRSDRTTILKGQYVFAGKDVNNASNSSWLWDALEKNEQFLQDVDTMDAALYTAGWNYDSVTEEQDDEFVGAWCQAMYNESGIVKYVNQFTESGDNYLQLLQGDRTPHRHWFLKTNYDYFDALHACGEYKTKIFYMRAGGANNAEHMYFTAGEDSYFGWGLTQTVQQKGIHKSKGDTFSLHININSGTLYNNDPIQIYAANKISEADFREIARYVNSTVILNGAYDEVTGTLLKKLSFGIPKTGYEKTITNDDGTTRVVYIEGMNDDVLNIQDSLEFSGLTNLTRIEEFNIQGLSKLDSIDVSEMPLLKVFYAAGSGITAFDPADGSEFTTVELPTSVVTMSMNGVKLYRTGVDCVISWWKYVEGTGVVKLGTTTGEAKVPHTLTNVRFVGMGDDTGAQTLILEWLHALRDNSTTSQNLFSFVSLYYSAIDWRNMSISDLLLLAKIPASQRTLTGYIKCSSQFTVEQMNTLMNAFGTTIFTKGSPLIIDCDSTEIIVSATGDYTTIAEDGTVEVLQGTTAKLSAVGFPIIASHTPVNTWGVYKNGETVIGTAAQPEVDFGSGHASVNTFTGVITTTECGDDDLTYRVDVENDLAATGTINVKIKKRTYPSTATISYVSGQVPATMKDGVLQILNTSHYMFKVTHNTSAGGTDYSGNRLDLNGVKWELVDSSGNVSETIAVGDNIIGKKLYVDAKNASGTVIVEKDTVLQTSHKDALVTSGITSITVYTVEDLYVKKCSEDYSAEGMEYDELCLNVWKLPYDTSTGEFNFSIRYTSYWKNGLTIVSPLFSISLNSVVEILLSTSTLSGNIPLFYMIEEAGFTHENPAYTSYELKQKPTVTLNLSSLYEAIKDKPAVKEPTQRYFTNTMSHGYNVLHFLKSIKTLNFDGCTHFETDIDIVDASNYSTLTMHNTELDVNLGTGTNLINLAYGKPSRINVDSPIRMYSENLTVDDGASVSSVVMKSFPYGGVIKKLSDLYDQGLPAMSSVLIYQNPETAELIENFTTGYEVENLASITRQTSSDVTTSTGITANINATHVYYDSWTYLHEKFPNLTITYVTPYIRWKDREFEKCISKTAANSGIGDGVGVTVIMAQTPESLNGVIRNKTAIENLEDLYQITSLRMPSCADATTSDFSGCSGIKTICLPAALPKIGKNTFVDMPNISSMDFSRCTAIESIEDGAFSNCTHDIDIDLSNCSNIKDIHLNGLTNAKKIKVKNAVRLTTVKI